MIIQQRNTSLADKVFERIENDIVFGVFKKGEILTERKLAEQLGVSRTPIREALRRLEQERLIADTPKGSVVLGITKEDLEDIMNVRMYIEGMAAYYATLNLDEKDIDEIKHNVELQEYYVSKNDIVRIKDMDEKFHRLICYACKRQVICDTLLPLRKKVQKFLEASVEKDFSAKKAVEEHREIFDAILARDAEKAKELLYAHISNVKNSILDEENWD